MCVREREREGERDVCVCVCVDVCVDVWVYKQILFAGRYLYGRILTVLDVEMYANVLLFFQVVCTAQ